MWFWVSFLARIDAFIALRRTLGYYPKKHMVNWNEIRKCRWANESKSNNSNITGTHSNRHPALPIPPVDEKTIMSAKHTHYYYFFNEWIARDGLLHSPGIITPNNLSSFWHWANDLNLSTCVYGKWSHVLSIVPSKMMFKLRHVEPKNFICIVYCELYYYCW